MVWHVFLGLQKTCILRWTQWQNVEQIMLCKIKSSTSSTGKNFWNREIFRIYWNELLRTHCCYFRSDYEYLPPQVICMFLILLEAHISICKNIYLILEVWVIKSSRDSKNRKNESDFIRLWSDDNLSWPHSILLGQRNGVPVLKAFQGQVPTQDE